MNLKKLFDKKSVNEDKIKYLIALQILLIVVISLYLYVIFPNQSIRIPLYIYVLGWVGIITFISSAFLYYRATNTFFSPYMAFFASFFVFQFGQWVLYSLDIDYDFIHRNIYSSFWLYSVRIVLKGTAMIIMSIAFFNLGALISLLRPKQARRNIFAQIENSVSNKALRVSGWLLFTISVIPTFYNRIAQAIISIQEGYAKSLSATYGFQGLLGNLYILFVPSCILLLVSYKNYKPVKLTFEAILVLYALVSLLVGGRTDGIAIIVVIVLYNFMLAARVNFKKLLLLAVTGFLCLSLISTFSEFRNMKNKTPEAFASTFIDNVVNDNPAISAIGEMGWSMSTIFITMRIVPYEIPYNYGKVYAASLSRIIPSSLDPTGTLSRLHQISESPTNLVTDFLKADFGMDSTLIGESYYSFGFFGIIAIFVIGIIIGKILGYRAKDNIVNKELSFYIKLAMLYAIFTLPRRQFGYLVTQFTYVVLAVVAFTVMVSYIINKRENKKIINNI